MTFEWQFRYTGGRGVSEYGSIGVLECWSVGVMGRWGEDGEYQHVLFRDGSVFQHSIRNEVEDADEPQHPLAASERIP